MACEVLAAVDSGEETCVDEGKVGRTCGAEDGGGDAPDSQGDVEEDEVVVIVADTELGNEKGVLAGEESEGEIEVEPIVKDLLVNQPASL